MLAVLLTPHCDCCGKEMIRHNPLSYHCPDKYSGKYAQLGTCIRQATFVLEGYWIFSGTNESVIR